MSIEALKNQLEVEHSKKNTIFIVDKIVGGKYSLTDVLTIIKDNHPLFSQRASWIISTISDSNPQLLFAHYLDLVALIDRKYHDATLRAIFRALAKIDIKEDEQGIVFEKGTALLTNMKTAPAIKIWIIDVLLKISGPYPELQNELMMILKPQLSHVSKGLKGKILKTIVKINDNFDQVG
jgi:hypothetical protein